MSQVSVTINGRDYQIGCNEGQESHLGKLAEFVDQRVGELSSAAGQIGDMRLLVMASLLIADELWELRDGGENGAAAVAPIPGRGGANSESDGGDDALAGAINALAGQIEDIAVRLEAS